MVSVGLLAGAAAPQGATELIGRLRCVWNRLTLSAADAGDSRSVAV